MQCINAQKQVSSNLFGTLRSERMSVYDHMCRIPTTLHRLSYSTSTVIDASIELVVCGQMACKPPAARAGWTPEHPTGCVRKNHKNV